MTRYKLVKFKGELYPCMIRADDGIYYSVGEVDREIERLEHLIIKLTDCIHQLNSGVNHYINRSIIDDAYKIEDKHNIISKGNSDEEVLPDCQNTV